jgi:phosphonate transport system substrate-binding protein
MTAKSAWAQSYSFGVVPLRNAVLSAKYWNPILDYVTEKSGVRLEFATKKSSLDYSEAEARGEFDFDFNNHIFAPSHTAVGYRVIARPAGKPLHGQIVVPENSAIRSAAELQDREVGFPSKNAFFGYAVPMSGLLQAKLKVKPVYCGNQEGVMAQLRSGAIPAASVNSAVMREYAARMNFKYRALWTSDPFLDIPVAVHPRVPVQAANAVRDALAQMVHDPAGLKILTASAAVIGQKPPFGFLPATDSEYQNQRDVYRTVWKEEDRAVAPAAPPR